MNQDIKNRLLCLIKTASKNGVNVEDYNSFVNYLRQNKEYNIKCHLIMYKYLYGSLIREAISL